MTPSELKHSVLKKEPRERTGLGKATAPQTSPAMGQLTDISLPRQASPQELVRVLEAFVAPTPTTSVEQVSQAAEVLRGLLEGCPSSAFRNHNGALNRRMLSNALEVIVLSDGMPRREAFIRSSLTGAESGKSSLDPFISAGLEELVTIICSSAASDVTSHDGLCDRIHGALEALKADTLRRHTGRGDVIKTRLAAAGDLTVLQAAFSPIKAELDALIELIPIREGGMRSPIPSRVARHCEKYRTEVAHCHLGEASRSLTCLQDAVEAARQEFLRASKRAL